MEKRYSFKTVAMLVSLTALFAILGTGGLLFYLFGLGSPLRPEVRRFQEVREIIAARYVGEVSESELTDAALAATVFALGDRWSRFLTVEEYADYLRSVGNRQRSIGISFQRQEDTNELLIVHVQRGSPAEEAGLVPGDIIVTIAGEPTAELETEEVRQFVTDHFGLILVLEVLDEAGDLRTVEVEVKEFYINPVEFEMKEGDIGYISISNFDLTAGSETILAIETLIEEGAIGLIFDVRSNPGGRVHELLMILDYLLPEGEMFVFEDQYGRERIEFSSATYLDMPIVVLINENSFSAAEFFAAALQEFDRAQIVGMPTSGKGRSQVVIPLSDGSAIRLSTSRYLTPGRVDLYEAGGIQPDFLVEDEDSDVDLQLERALGLLVRG